MHGVWLDKGQQPAHSFACRKRNGKKEPTGLETRKTRIFTRRPEADVAGGAASSAPPPRAPSARPLAALALEHPAHSCVPPEPAGGPGDLSCPAFPTANMPWRPSGLETNEPALPIA